MRCWEVGNGTVVLDPQSQMLKTPTNAPRWRPALFERIFPLIENARVKYHKYKENQQLFLPIVRMHRKAVRNGKYAQGIWQIVAFERVSEIVSKKDNEQRQEMAGHIDNKINGQLSTRRMRESWLWLKHSFELARKGHFKPADLHWICGVSASKTGNRSVAYQAFVAAAGAYSNAEKKENATIAALKEYVWHCWDAHSRHLDAWKPSVSWKPFDFGWVTVEGNWKALVDDAKKTLTSAIKYAGLDLSYVRKRMAATKENQFDDHILMQQEYMEF